MALMREVTDLVSDHQGAKKLRPVDMSGTRVLQQLINRFLSTA